MLEQLINCRLAKTTSAVVGQNQKTGHNFDHGNVKILAYIS